MGNELIPQPMIADSASLPGNAANASEMLGRAESIEQFRELMEHLQQVFWIKTVSKMEVLYVSPAYEKIWGRTRQSLYDDMQSLEDSIFQEDRKRVVSSWGSGGGWEHEFRILRPDGEMRWIKSQSYPVRNELREIQRYAGIDTDITELKNAEKELSRLAAIVEFSDDAFVSMSVDGIIIHWNRGAERLYGYSADEIIGHPCSILCPPDYQAEHLEVLKKIKRGEPVAAYETVRQRKDGTLVTISLSMSPIENRGGEVVGASKISHDLTRLRKLEAQFIEAQKMEVVGQLAAGVAHDFNNVLGVIMGYSELIEQSLSASNPLQRYAEEIRHATERASGLTRQLLVFSRKQTIEAVILDLNDVVESMEKMLRRLIDENINMTLVYAKEGCHLRADSGYIWQVLMNLVVNARDAMPNGGPLTIETSQIHLDETHAREHPGMVAGDYAMLSVRDTGSGMTEEVKAHLFEAFFTTKPIGKGTGLGLVTCQTIVRQSGGHIEVSSTLGHGTTFKVYFPLVEKPPAVAASIRAKTGPLRLGTETLLVVEDEPALRQLAREVLQAKGYHVLTASNGKEALRIASEHAGPPIRLVITDVIMPMMDGKVMAEWLKTTYPDLRVLFTSGYTDEAIAHHGVLDPDVAFLAKPYTPGVLTRRVREMLDAPRAQVRL